MKKRKNTVVFRKSQIQKRVKEMGRQITFDYQNKDLILIGVLRGAFVFLSDLSRAIKIPCSIDFIAISGYGPASSGVVRLLKDLEENIEGKDVILVEDIIDTGLTVSYLLRNLKARNPRSLEVCTLLNRSIRRIVDLPIKYIGFDIPDVFVVGYGLDYGQRYRNLSHIRALEEKDILAGVF